MDLLDLKVIRISTEATDIKTIFLQPADGGSPEYQAGQFLTLLFEFHGLELRRSYSFSTTPGVDPISAITVKRIPNGEISRYLLDHLQPGDTLLSLPPAGRFTLEPMPAPGPIGFATPPAQPALPGTKPPQLFFLAAGSGLVPIFSLIKQALRTKSDITLITQQHEPASTVAGTLAGDNASPERPYPFLSLRPRSLHAHGSFHAPHAGHRCRPY